MIIFKLLVWYLALRFGDSGPGSRPWIWGCVIGVVFGVSDILGQSPPIHVQALVLGSYLAAGLAIMHIYFRIESIVFSVLTCAIGTAVLFFGVPFVLIPALL